MPDYLITWVDYAFEQYPALDQSVGTRLNEQLRVLAKDPRRNAHHEGDTDRWSVDFDAGRGLLVYIVNTANRRIVILRILHLG